jgi:hypothetical protein
VTRIPFHPVLIAMVPVLSMFAANPGVRHDGELQEAIRAVVAVSAFLLLLTAAAYRDVRKAALWLSAVLVLFMVFDTLYAGVENITIGEWRPGRRRYVVPLTYSALAVLALRIARWRTSIGPLTGLANMVALGAVVPPVVLLGIARTPAASPAVTVEPIVAGAVTAKPDIYYLVFDRYGDEETARAYGLENEIDEELTSKGFYVAQESRSNYIKTVLSLASSLNAGYLDEVVRGRERTGNWGPVYDHLARHRVGAFLRGHGYSYTHFGSWYYPTQRNPQATRNVNYYTEVPRAVMMLLDNGLFSPVQRVLREPWLDERLQGWLRVRQQVDDVLRLVPTRGPKFVFFHVLVPHPPYIFERDASFVPKDKERQRSFAENYCNQVLAANIMIRRLVDGILRDSASPPVIIVQGDEGPYPPGTLRDDFDWRTAGANQLRVRSGILNAYHLPGADPHVLYPTISPVNSFRVVFNAYFGTNLPVLPDRTIRHVSDYQPFVFDDVTQQVTTMARAAASPP